MSPRLRHGLLLFLAAAACAVAACAPVSAIALTLIGTGTYAAVGAGIDALIPGRQRIWPAGPQKGGGLTFAVSPREHRAFIGWRVGSR